MPSNTMVDIMNGLNDPRRDVFFTDPIDGEYIGGIYGSANSYAEFSHIGDVYHTPTLPGVLMSCSEVMFLYWLKLLKGALPYRKLLKPTTTVVLSSVCMSGVLPLPITKLMLLSLM